MNGVSRWKTALLTLEDQIFFDLMRGCFGELKTPFNKHRLIEQLAAFLQKPAVRKRVISLIDADDAKLITAIALLENPDTAEIAKLYAGERSYLDLHHHLLNLEERFLLYREKEDGGRRLRLNPLFEETLRKRVVDPSLLFPSYEASAAAAVLPWLTDPLLVAFLSYLARGGELMKAGGGLKKKSEQELSSIFPQLMIRNAGGTRVFRLTAALVSSGLISGSGNGFSWKFESLEAFARLPRPQRYYYLWTAASAGWAGERPAAAVRHLIGFLQSIPEGRGFTRTVLKRLLEFSGWEGKPESAGERFLESVEDLGLLVKSGTQTADEAVLVKNPLLADILEPAQTAGEPAVIIQPNFTLSLKPGAPLEHVALVALCTDVLRYDIYPQFELTRESCARAFAAGRTADELIAELEALSGQQLPQNIRFSIRHWAAEYSSVGLYRGIVLQVDEERRPLVEHSEELQRLVRKTLAPGVYLLAAEDAPAWRKALEKSGIRLVPEVKDVSDIRRRRHGKKHHDLPPVLEELQPVEQMQRSPAAVSAVHGESTYEPGDSIEAVQRELFSKLDELKLPPEIREELAERIRKKLVAFPEQLSAGTLRKEKTEAKGLDFSGKLRLIEQAVSGGKDFLEIVIRTQKGEPEKYLVKPLEIEKRGTNLNLKGILLPQGTEERFNIRKIGIVKKLRGSLYTG